VWDEVLPVFVLGLSQAYRTTFAASAGLHRPTPRAEITIIMRIKNNNNEESRKKLVAAVLLLFSAVARAGTPKPADYTD
jgi:hypothetical protein